MAHARSAGWFAPALLCCMVSSLTARADSPTEAPPPAPALPEAPAIAPGALDGGRSLPAQRASHAPAIDGTLDDDVWRSATPVEGFGQQVPKTGQPPSMATVVRFAYDADRLYLAIECRDPEPGRIAAPLTRRDRAVEGDWIAMELDSLGDRKTAFGFGVYASNVQFDYIRSGDNARDYDWDAVWISATQVDQHGWTAELAIPFKALRFKAAPAVSFRVELDRYISRLGETDQLVIQPPSEQGALLRMATLTGLEGVSRGYGLELRPFVLTSFDHRHSPGPAYDPPSGNHARFSAGGELSYRLRNDLVVDGTVLPDFGQVEADQVILNLSTFETFFPEKRPFFLSGADLFALHDHLGSPTETQLFYSRRIGQVPGSLELPSDARIVDQPAAAEIWGAAKLTGRVSDHVSVAVLDAVTRQQDATIQAADGSRQGIPVSPLSNFAVARLRAELPAGFTVGAMATDVARHDLASVGAANCSGTTTAHCANNAATGGVDATWSSPDGEWVGAASLLASRLIAGPTHKIPDGTTIRAGDSGLGGQLTLAKAGGEHWLADLKYEGYSRKLDLNEAGYLRRSNLSQITADLDYRTTEPWAFTRKTDNVLTLKAWDTIDGVRLVRLLAPSTAVELENFWGFTAELDYAPAMQDNRELRDGTPYERPYLIQPVIGLHSDARKAVSFSALASAGNQLRGYQYSVDATVLVRLSQRFELSLLPHFDHSFGDPRWVATEGTGASRSYLFGDLDVRSASLTLRGIFTFNPNLTLQAYAFGFVAAAHYGPFYAANGGAGQVRLKDLHDAAAPATNPDFKDGNININVALRWEYRPGSTLFLVYSRAQTIGDQTADQSPTRPDYLALRRGPSDDVVLLKVSYWFGT